MSMKYVYFAFGVGITLGASAALLYAPQTGASARKKLKRSADDATDYLEDTASYLKEQASKLADQAEELVKQTRGSVADAIDQASDFVSKTVDSAQKLV
ncbi:MAG: YtxH domain-containing protein [Janthinobacterium lividum]